MDPSHEQDHSHGDDEKQREGYNSSPEKPKDNQEVSRPERQSQSQNNQEHPSSTTGTRGTKRQRRSKNSPEPDYSAIVQEQMSTTNRTGQACDRCKGRKMKCDSNPTGCANCIATDAVCTQTDPITKVSSVRGETERLRQEISRLQQENEELRRALQESNARLQQYESMTGHGQVATMGMGQVPQHYPFPQVPASYAGGSGASDPGRHQLTGHFQTTGGHYDNIQAPQGFMGPHPRMTGNFPPGIPMLPSQPQASPRNAYSPAYNVPQAGPTYASTTAVPPQQAQGDQPQHVQRHQSSGDSSRRRRSENGENGQY